MTMVDLAVDPVVLVKMVQYKYLYGIKSLCQTMRKVDMNTAFSWFIGYDIDTSFRILLP